MIRYEMISYHIFANCSCVATHWQQYSTHLHTDSTQGSTMKTEHTERNIHDIKNTKYRKLNSSTQNIQRYKIEPQSVTDVLQLHTVCTSSDKGRHPVTKIDTLLQR